LSLEAVRILLDKISKAMKQASIEEILMSESINKYCNVDTLEKIFHPVMTVVPFEL
jgi:hypothetical protein